MLMKNANKRAARRSAGRLDLSIYFTIIGIIRFAGAAGLVSKVPIYTLIHRKRLFSAARGMLGIKIYHGRAYFLV